MSFFEDLEHGLVTHSAAETETLAMHLAARLPVDSVLALYGELGAGKTTFVRGLARAWGIDDPITSPTYQIFTYYQGSRLLVHMDAYRLGSPEALDALMIEQFLESPYCWVIEWPERLGERLPGDAWQLRLEDLGEGRRRLQLQRPLP